MHIREAWVKFAAAALQAIMSRDGPAPTMAEVKAEARRYADEMLTIYLEKF